MKRATEAHILGILIYVVFAIYLINHPFQFIKIPEFILKYDSWIIFVGGILVLFGAINYFRINKKSKQVEVKS